MHRNKCSTPSTIKLLSICLRHRENIFKEWAKCFLPVYMLDNIIMAAPCITPAMTNDDRPALTTNWIFWMGEWTNEWMDKLEMRFAWLVDWELMLSVVKMEEVGPWWENWGCCPFAFGRLLVFDEDDDGAFSFSGGAGGMLIMMMLVTYNKTNDAAWKNWKIFIPLRFSKNGWASGWRPITVYKAPQSPPHLLFPAY